MDMCIYHISSTRHHSIHCLLLCGYHLKAVSFDADINEMGSYTWIYLTMIQLVLVCIVLTCWTLYFLVQFDD